MLVLGLKLILVTAPALAGVLHVLGARLVAQYHAELWGDVLTPARTWVQRRHLRRACAECELLAELATTRAG